MGGTKGAHIVVPAFPGQPKLACYVEAETDGRPFFIIPWNDMLLIGTTDIRHDGDPGDAHVDVDEERYLLEETNRVFPDAKLEASDILFHYTGVRPLARSTLKETGDITRRHVVKHHRRVARGLYSVIGGKLTTQRLLAEEVTDRVARRIGFKGGKCRTAIEALPGAAGDYASTVEALDGCDAIRPESREHLLRVYGCRAAEIRKIVDEHPELGTSICPHSHMLAAEVVFCLRHEMATTMADVLLRRTMCGLSRDLGRAALPRALAVAHQHLGWSEQRVAIEEKLYMREIGELSFAESTE
jgi:glycerol-3-phosphate dehydrogenase